MSCIISCTICSEAYKSTDDVYSTSCGHIYHFHCMQQWQSRFTSCPQCRTFRPSTHKIFLNFEDHHPNAEKQILELREEANINKLMRKWNEDQLREHEEQVEKLKDQVHYLMLINQGCRREIKVKSSEVSAFKELHAIRQGGENPSAMLAKLNDLEERFETIFLELTKDITRAIDLAVEQSRIENIIETAKLLEKLLEKQTVLSTEPTEAITPTDTTTPMSPTAVTPPNQPAVVETQPNTNVVEEVLHAVVVKGVQRKELENLGGPADVVWLLGHLMDLVIENEDIEKAFILKGKRYNNFSKKVSLVVEFKTLRKKLKFMKHWDRLQDYVEWDLVSVSHYMSAETSALYYHANALVNVGFTNIYCEGDRVFAKKYTSRPMHVTSKEQVDELLAEHDVSDRIV